MSENPPHACAQLARALADDSLPLGYTARTREYFIEYQDGGSAIQAIAFCPFCGARFPGGLYDEWLASLRAQGLDPFARSLPAAFETDEWWREAGL